MFMCVYMCVPAYVVFREQPEEPDTLFFGIAVSLAQSRPHRGGWPACKPQRSDWLTLPCAEIIM